MNWTSIRSGVMSRRLIRRIMTGPVDAVREPVRSLRASGLERDGDGAAVSGGLGIWRVNWREGLVDKIRDGGLGNEKERQDRVKRPGEFDNSEY